MRLLSCAILTLGVPPVLRAQGAPPRQAVAVGWSPAAGLIGGEWVRRAGPAGPLAVGFAAGAGIIGPGARVNLTLGRRSAAAPAARVPYVGVGIAPALWAPAYTSIRAAASAEGGVQFWPAARRRAYFDLGAGAALVARHGGGTDVGPVLRALAGVAF